MNALDKLGLAITDAGYTWTPEMRKAYEDGVKREWVGLTDDEIEEGQKASWVDQQAFESAVWWAEAKLKEKNT